MMADQDVRLGAGNGRPEKRLMPKGVNESFLARIGGLIPARPIVEFDVKRVQPGPANHGGNEAQAFHEKGIAQFHVKLEFERVPVYSSFGEDGAKHEQNQRCDLFPLGKALAALRTFGKISVYRENR